MISSIHTVFFFEYIIKILFGVNCTVLPIYLLWGAATPINNKHMKGLPGSEGLLPSESIEKWFLP